VARVLVDSDTFAKAVFALEDLVSDKLVNLQVFNFHYYAAIYYLEYSDVSMAYDHVITADKIATKLKQKQLEFKALTLMAVVFDKLGDLKTSLKIASEVLNIAKTPDELFIANINLFEGFRKLNDFEQGKRCLAAASEQLELVDDLQLLRFKIMNLEKQGWLSLDLAKVELSQKYFEEAITLSEKNNVLFDGYFSAMKGLGTVFHLKKQYQSSIDLAKKVIALDSAGDDIKMKAYRGMAKNYKAMDDYKNAYSSLEHAHELEQKIKSEKSDSKLKSWEARYKFNIERRDKEIALKEREIFELKTITLRERVIRGQMEMLQRLALAAEIRDDETSAHTMRVGKIVTQISLIMGLDLEYAKRLGFAAQFHDIGKIGIPDSILLKPAALTDEEFEAMKRHTTIGAQILSNSEMSIMKLSEIIAVSHHEKWDGSGYPNNLKGYAIPLAGRIVAVADAFDAMTSDRPYRKALDASTVRRELVKGAGSQFDELIVEKFLEWLDKNGIEKFNDMDLKDTDEELMSLIIDAEKPTGKGLKFLKTIYYSPLHIDKEKAHDKILVPV